MSGNVKIDANSSSTDLFSLETWSVILLWLLCEQEMFKGNTFCINFLEINNNSFFFRKVLFGKDNCYQEGLLKKKITKK